jgi:hypothetical protein
MGRRTRTKIPTSPNLLKPEIKPTEEVIEKKSEERSLAKKYFDRSAKDLQPLQEKENVRIRDWNNNEWKPAQVISKVHDRSYMVKTEEGRVKRRNRRDLMKTKEENIFQEKEEIPDEPEIRESKSPEIEMRRNQKPVNETATTRSGRAVKPNVRYKDFVKY